MLGGNFRNSPPKDVSVFRTNLLEVLRSADDLSDEDLKKKLGSILDEKTEKYQVRQPTIILKQLH